MQMKIGLKSTNQPTEMILLSEYLLRDRPGRHDWRQSENHDAVEWAEQVFLKGALRYKQLSETSQSLLAWRIAFTTLHEALNWYCELTSTNGRHNIFTYWFLLFIIRNLNVALDVFWKCPLYTWLSIVICLARVNVNLFILFQCAHSVRKPYTNYRCTKIH